MEKNKKTNFINSAVDKIRSIKSKHNTATPIINEVKGIDPKNPSLASQCSQDIYQLMIEAANDAIFIASADTGCIIGTNKKAEELLGMPREKIIGMHQTLLHPKEDIEKYKKVFEDHVKNGGGFSADLFVIKADGKKVPVAISATIVELNGQKIVYGIFKNITERKKVEEALLRDVGERKRAQERITKMNECFLKLGVDPIKNINQLTALCGELLEADCALYNRIEDGMLCAVGNWNAPPDFKITDKPDGHICYDVVRQSDERIFVVCDLPNTNYAKTDPNVTKYKLRTYIGCPVKFDSRHIGSLCVVYTRDFTPTEEDEKLIGIIASAIGVEEERRKAEESQKQEHNLLKTLVDNLPDYIYVKDEESRFLIANNSVSEVMGAKSSVELIGKTDFDFYPKELAQKYYEDEQVIIKTGKPLINHEETCISQTDKRKMSVLTTKMPLRDAHGKVVGIIGIGHDITEQKKAEEVSREGERFLARIFASIQDGISILDPEFNIIRVNPTIEKWYSHMKPLVGKKCFEAYHCEDKPCEVCPTRQTIKTGYPAYEIVPKTGKDGKVVGWLDLYTFPMFDKATGKLNGVIEYVRDISGRKQAEEKVLLAKKKYADLVTNLNVGVYRATPGEKGTFLEVNPSMVSMFDADLKEELMKYNVSDLYQDSSARNNVSKKLLKFGYIKNEEIPFLTLKKRKFWGSVTAVMKRLDRGDVYFDGIVEDVTERKQAEEALNYRVEFEKLITAISTNFINIKTDEIDKAINASLKRIGEFARVDRSYVFLADEDLTRADNTHEWCAEGITPEISKLKGMSERRFPWFAKTLKNLDVIYIPSLKALPKEAKKVKEFLESRSVKSVVCVPMVYAGMPIGFLGFDSIKEEKTWSEENIALLKIVGEIFVNAIERKRAQGRMEVLNKELLASNKKLKQSSLIDSHTGLYNHRYVGEVIEAEFYRARRYAHPLSVIMLDIDYFKSINEVYGHKFGDLVLKQLAKQLKKMVRQYDVVVRFGGEEFVIISPGTDRATSLVLSQRLLDAISLINFGNKKCSVKLKLSVAVTSYPEDKVTKGMDLIETADQIISKVKEYGGNKVYSFLDLKREKASNAKKGKTEGDIRFLKDRIDRLTKRSNQNLIEAVFAFAKTIELKDRYTGEHVERTVGYATEIAKELNLPKEEIEDIKKAAILHDLGKIGISEKLLLKKMKLTKKEFSELKQHPQIGVDIIRPIQSLHNIIPLVLYHHERWDGKGYPSGLKREEIPIGARVVAIADVYQALTSNRPYRKAYSKSKAIEIIKKGSGTQFDPKIVGAFLNILHSKK